MSYPFKIQMNNSLRMANGWPMRSVEPVIEQRMIYPVLNGVSQHIEMPPMTTSIGDVLTWVNENVVDNFGYVFWSEEGHYLRVWTDGTIFFGGCTVTIDGVDATSLITTMPTSNSSVIVVTFAAVATISALFVRHIPSLQARWLGGVHSFKHIRGSETLIDYPMDDGWDNNPVIKNYADLSGSTDATAIGFTEDTWANLID